NFTVHVADSGSQSANEALSITVAAAGGGTTTTLTGVTPSAASTFGQSITLSAQVSPTGAPGSVAFMDGAVMLGVGTLDSSGLAQLSTIGLTAGSHSLRAVYGGNGGSF